MKKLLAALLACMTITCAFASCGDDSSKKEEKSSKVTSEKEDEDKDDDKDDDKDEDSKAEKKSDKKSSDESSEDESSEESKDEKKSDKKSGGSSAEAQDVTGVWYSDEIQGSFVFGEDNKFAMQIDVSEMMTIDEKGVVHMNGDDTDYTEYCSYDGETFSFIMNQDSNGNGEDISFEMMTMKRRDGVNKDSAYGEYTLISGYLYDQFASDVSDPGDRYGIIVSKDSLVAVMDMGSYSVDGDKIILDEEALSYFGLEDSDDATFEYKLDGDKLTLINDGDELELVKK